MKASSSSKGGSSRREFLKSSSSAVVGGVVAPYLAASGRVFGGTNSLRVGLIGCGGRGTGAASQALNADQNVVLTAMADVFRDKLDRSMANLKRQLPDKVQIPSNHQFVGLNAYQELIDSDVDLIILATPPGFRPIHLKAAVDAGKNIFCEKPMATDAPGLRSVIASAAEARRKGLALMSGFCWRYNYARRAFYQKIRQGAIGEVRSVYATYYTGPVKPMPPANRRPPSTSDLEWQLRNWYNFTWLGGDSLVEQAVHSVDKTNWLMGDQPPERAVATGGRQIPSPGGNIFDHFAVYYEYQNGLRAFVGSRQIGGCHNENKDYIYGSEGTGYITWGRVYLTDLKGRTFWRYRGPDPNMYQVEHDELFASIRNGNPINDGDWMTKSTMMALMGRMAAYTGQEISWDQAMGSQKRLVPDYFEWDMPLPVRPMARPGKTQFV